MSQQLSVRPHSCVFGGSIITSVSTFGKRAAVNYVVEKLGRGLFCGDAYSKLFMSPKEGATQ